MTDTLSGWHGRRDGSSPTDAHDLFLGLDTTEGRDDAEEWAGADGEVWRVTFTARNALHVRTAEHYAHVWHESGADSAVGRFHPDTTRVLTGWLRSQGHDAVVFHPETFDTDDQELWEITSGTIGDPQAVVLERERAKAKRAERLP